MIVHTCAKCNLEMRCLKNEVYVVHFMNNDREQGIDAARIGDLWGCDKCGARVVLGMGDQIYGGELTGTWIRRVLENTDMIEIKR